MFKSASEEQIIKLLHIAEALDGDVLASELGLTDRDLFELEKYEGELPF